MFSLFAVFNWFLTLFCVLLSAWPSFGARVEGTVSKFQNKFYIRDKNDTKYQLEFTTVSMELIASRLKTRDFISVEGSLDEEETLVTVSSINFVGLQSLIGRWSDADGFCYEFENYQTFKVYRKTATRTCLFLPAFLNRSMTYTINPANENWLMLVSDSSDSFLLDLVIKNKNSIHLILYDPHTADVIRKIVLTRTP